MNQNTSDYAFYELSSSLAPGIRSSKLLVLTGMQLRILLLFDNPLNKSNSINPRDYSMFRDGVSSSYSVHFKYWL